MPSPETTGPADHRPPDSEALWAMLLDGAELSPDQRNELKQRLARDPQARRRYVDLMLLDTLLSEELAAESIGDLVDAVAADATESWAARTASLPSVAPPSLPKSTAPASRHASTLRPAHRWFAASAAAAMLMLGAFVWTFLGRETELSAATLVTETLRVHQLPLDRCYVIKIERIGDREINEERLLWGARARVDRLWTRGDRFFLESSTDRVRFRWGQDSDGRVWMTHGKQTGLVFEPAELPPWLATVCDALSMRLEPMLGEVLNHCDLSWETPAGEADPAASRTRVVRAVNSYGLNPRWLKEARLEIDLDTRVLRKLTVVRQVGWRQAVTVSYTLAASESQPDDRYDLKGHLTEPFVVYSRTNQPQKRTDILAEHFGTVIARTLLAPVEIDPEPASKSPNPK